MHFRPYPEGTGPPDRGDGDETEFPRFPLRFVVSVVHEFEAQGVRCVVSSLEAWDNVLVVRYAGEYTTPPPHLRRDLSMRELMERARDEGFSSSVLAGRWEARDEAGTVYGYAGAEFGGGETAFEGKVMFRPSPPPLAGTLTLVPRDREDRQLAEIRVVLPPAG